MGDTPPTYPAIRMINKFGSGLAFLAALAPLAIALWGVVAAGVSWVWFLPAAAVAALLWLVFQSYVEVLRILADTLMPR